MILNAPLKFIRHFFNKPAGLNKGNKGFTLIELLVVISIIALLSSVVLVGVQAARQRAKSVAFRASIDQVIKALEMYRNDNGQYPGAEQDPDSRYQVSTDETGSLTIRPNINLQILLLPYIKTLPIPAQNGSQWNYRITPTTGCEGSSQLPPYKIKINSIEPGFEDWKYNLFSDGSVDESFRCFSLQ